MTENKRNYERKRYLAKAEERRAYQREYYRSHRTEILRKKRMKAIGYVPDLEPESAKIQRLKERRKAENARYYMNHKERKILNVLRRRHEKKLLALSAE